ncbi:MAG: 4-phosphopantetheinyl transferase family protein, partial [Flavobacteriales bacterium]|nr:4-phosphopantetheinyl transferase family protein [Flavobacteriales bacterium]
LDAIPKEDRSDLGLKLFTAKEAFIKATDKQYGLDEIEFVLVEGSWSLQLPKRNCTLEHIIHEDIVIAISVLLG